MPESNQEKLTQDMLAAFTGTPDARRRELMTARVKHVQAFAREVGLKPDDGPVGVMMRATTRSIYRPGQVMLTTHIFVAGSPYIDADAVFGKRDSLVVDVEIHPPGQATDGRAMQTPYHSASLDFRLAPTPHPN